VILATAIVHMFQPAVLLLSNPCLPDVWLTGYAAFASAFFLLGILGTHLLQVILTARMSNKPADEAVSFATNDIETATLEPKAPCCDEVTDTDCQSPQICHSDHVNHHMDLGVLDTDEHCHGDTTHKESTHAHSHGLSLLKERQLSVYLLEIGIFSHSVLIGITLGTARSEFTTLLIALCFHQFFEGMALSAVLVESATRQEKFKLVNFLYCLTTPIGICIGIGAHSLYNDNSVTSILVQGILDSLSGKHFS